MKRRVLLGLVGLVLLAGLGTLGIEHLLSPAPGPTPENFRRLHTGMHKNRVFAILGEPHRKQEGAASHDWTNSDETWSIVITVNDEERAVSGGLISLQLSDNFESLREDPGVWGRLRAWLRL
jgi:hypothetical protein